MKARRISSVQRERPVGLWAGECPRPSQLALFVAGGMEPAEQDALSTHVEGCAACARTLQAEAQLEVKLWALARTQAARRAASGATPRWWSGSRLRRLLPQGQNGRLALALTAAAALVVAVVLPAGQHREQPSRPDSLEAAPGSALAPEPRGAHDVLAQRGDTSLRHSVLIDYPGALGSFPHPEMTGRRHHRLRGALDGYGVEQVGLWSYGQPTLFSP